MTNGLMMTGMVLSTMPVGEYDKRVVLLTKESGKISAFARGARRPKSRLVAAANPMAFGTFEIFPGRTANSIASASIDDYFLEIAQDYDKVCLAAYFLEMAEYYAQENLNETERLALLYQTLKALRSGRFSLRLIRMIYEIRTMKINGVYPDVFECVNCGKRENLHYFSMPLRGLVCDDCHDKAGGEPISDSCRYAMQFIMTQSIQKLYTFRLTDAVEEELWKLLAEYRKRYREHAFKSEEFL